ncbi:MAG: hypothetical protein ABI131_11350 [Nostocoides sp.]
MPSSPVPEAVADELSRLVRRWQQLPVDQASVRLPRVLTVVAGLASLSGADAEPPDLGPAVVMDQLAVTAYDACVHGHAEDALALLTALRRDL